MNPQHEALKKFGYQINFAIENFSKHGLNIADFNNVFIGGMGGSGIGGRLVKNIFTDTFPLPVEVVADYLLPGYVNNKTLVILGSYSGNTEETIAIFNAVKEKGCTIVVLTGGGKLGTLAKENNLKTYMLPLGFQPRMALGFSLTYLIQLFAELLQKDVTDELKNIAALLNNTTPYEEDAWQVFEAIKAKCKSKFIVLSDGPLEALALRFAQQIQENAKHECFVNVLPEHNHNAIESYYGQMDTVFFFLNSHQSERITARFEFLNSLLEVEYNTVIEIGLNNLSLAGIYQTIHRLDWLSLYLADYKKVDSLNVPNIVSLKEFLDKA